MRKEKRKKKEGKKEGKKERNTHPHTKTQRRGPRPESPKMPLFLASSDRGLEAREGVQAHDLHARDAVSHREWSSGACDQAYSNLLLPSDRCVQREAFGLCDRGKSPHGCIINIIGVASSSPSSVRSAFLSSNFNTTMDEEDAEYRSKGKALDLGWMDRRNESGLLGRNVETRSAFSRRMQEVRRY